MVTIPTSRDVSYVGSRSGRIAPAGPSVSVGAAVADAGQALTQTAYNLNDLAVQEAIDTRNKAGFDLETKMAEFRDAEEQAFNKAREEASESGIGFTRQFIEGYQKRANDFVKSNLTGVSEGQDAQSRQALLGLGNSLYGKAYDYEQKSKTLFYDRTTNQGLDTVRGQIKNNAAPYEELKRQGLAAIDAADMPEAWKAERRALWESDAAESKWQWKFANDPQAAIREIKGQPAGNVVDKIIGVESGGNATAKNPNSSATGAGQFIASTWMNMIKRYRPDVAAGKSTPEILALRNDPALSREMTAAYTSENGEYLKNQGIETTDGNLYLAHFLGPGGASRVIKADPSAPVASVIGQDAVNANPFLKGKSIADLRAWSDKKMGGAGVSTEYDAIPYDRRAQLAAWGETQYNQQLVQQRTATKDNYNLLIATNPDQVDESVILQDVNLDNGDKATLINSLNTARKENAGVNSFIGSLGAGAASVNPFDGEQTKIADKAFEKMLGAATTPEQQQTVMSGFVAASGYVPKKVQAELRRGAASTNPVEVAQSMQAASVLQKNAPISFNGFEGGDTVRKNLDLYRTYTEGMGLSPDEAGRKIIDLNDPEKVRQRDAILKSEPVKKVLKDVSASDVAAIFDKGFWHAAPDVGGVPTQEAVKVGVNTEAEAAIVADYRGILQESIAETGGDMDAAKELANQRFSRNYGVSELSPLGSSVVIKYPPEKVYPAAPDGTHDYIRDQAVEALKAEGVNPETIYLQAYEGTAQDIKAGRPARYEVFYEQDGKLERYFLPFFADPEAGKVAARAKQEQTLRDAGTRMIENRSRFASQREADQRSYDETQGPDWMKARQMQADQERRRQDETLERLRGDQNPITTGPINGGGGGGY
ncbi:hypothetical protein [Sinorhizobium meliloti]|uniref:hypothetical protein n=1 Tax=Rhizobium meliloti TaxID=382 RepID=UPI000FD7BC9C|nr:hypothetical protein [Sinorhizobium meliloti]RVN58494.1 hypothetical protein CN108_05510 [Sinorhizobium meliloti]